MELPKIARLFAILIAAVTWSQNLPVFAKDITLLNVSYDPTRALYQEINKTFSRQWNQKTGDRITIQQSHGGSGKQARAVIDGLAADVVTLALGYDVDAIAEKGGRLPGDWQKRFPHNSTPYSSTVVFLVRKGNPKSIKDWDDLVRSKIAVITPNPKTSGGARWNYLAAWGYAVRKFGNEEGKARDFVARLYRNVPMLDSGARGSTTTFVQRGIGDVCISWESEAFLAVREFGADKFEMVVPSLSILAEPPVAIVEKNARKKGTEVVAKAYLDFLYSDEGQEIAGRHFFRPSTEKMAVMYSSRFPKITLFTIDEIFGGWQKAHKTHFSTGGVFDQIYRP